MSSDRERIREAVRAFEAGEVYGTEPLPLENQNSMGVNEVWVAVDGPTVDTEGWQIGTVYYRHCETLYFGAVYVGAVPATYDKDWYTNNEKVKIRSANSGAISNTTGPSQVLEGILHKATLVGHKGTYPACIATRTGIGPYVAATMGATSGFNFNTTSGQAVADFSFPTKGVYRIHGTLEMYTGAGTVAPGGPSTYSVSLTYESLTGSSQSVSAPWMLSYGTTPIVAGVAQPPSVWISFPISDWVYVSDVPSLNNPATGRYKVTGGYASTTGNFAGYLGPNGFSYQGWTARRIN
jgi:hypothetical protein